MCIKFPCQSSYREAMVVYLCRISRLPPASCRISVKSANWSKKRVVTGIVTTHQCDQLPLLTVKRSSMDMNAGTPVSLAPGQRDSRLRAVPCVGFGSVFHPLVICFIVSPAKEASPKFMNMARISLFSLSLTDRVAEKKRIAFGANFAEFNL